MSLFTNPQIKKRWEQVLKRDPQSCLQGTNIICQGSRFCDYYLIIEGVAEIYRQLSFKKLGIRAHITNLSPFDIICLNGNQEAKYTVRVKSHQLKYIKLRQNQKQIVCMKAVNQWRKSQAEILQKKFNAGSRTKIKYQQNQKNSMIKFIKNNGPAQKQSWTKSSTKLPSLKTYRNQIDNRSTSILKDRKTPMCQNRQRLFNSVLKQYLSKRIDYQSNNIPLTICSSMEIGKKYNKQNI